MAEPDYARIVRMLPLGVGAERSTRVVMANSASGANRAGLLDPSVCCPLNGWPRRGEAPERLPQTLFPSGTVSFAKVHQVHEGPNATVPPWKYAPRETLWRQNQPPA